MVPAGIEPKRCGAALPAALQTWTAQVWSAAGRGGARHAALAQPGELRGFSRGLVRLARQSLRPSENAKRIHSHPTEKALSLLILDFTGLQRALRAYGDCDFFEEMNIQQPTLNIQ